MIMMIVTFKLSESRAGRGPAGLTQAAAGQATQATQ